MTNRPLVADICFVLQLMVGLFAIIELFAGDWPVFVCAVFMWLFCQVEGSILRGNMIDQIRKQQEVSFEFPIVKVQSIRKPEPPNAA